MADVLDAAYYIAKRSGLRGLTRDRVAEHARVSTGTVSHAFAGMDKLVSKVVARAIEEQELSIIAEALVRRHPLALKADYALRKRAAATLAGQP